MNVSNQIHASVRRRRLSVLVPALVCLAAGLPLSACGQESATVADTANAITIYSSARPGAIPAEWYRPSGNRHYFGGNNLPGFAVVRQDRDYDIGRGRSELRVTDVAAMIEPTTVTFQSLSEPRTRVLEQSFEFDLVSNDKLLQRYLGQDIVVEQARGETVDEIAGRLVGIAGGLILQQPDGGVRTINHYSSIRFPELPGGLITRPTLVWDLDSPAAGRQQTRVSYQTGGMVWWADYNAILDESRGCKLDLSAWVSIINQSGASFENTRLKLIAGDVHRAEDANERRMVAARVQELAMADAAGFEEKAFFEYHLYTLGRPTDLPDNATRQIELFPTARDISCQKELVFAPGRQYRYHGGTSLDQNYGRSLQAEVGVFVSLENAEDNQLGIPLPAGRLRVSQQDSDGAMEFIGEDVIDHTPKNETVRVKLGNAFDVVGERVQTDFRIDTRTRNLWETFEISLRNHKEEAVTVKVVEPMYRSANWKIENPSMKFSKADSQTIHFDAEVEKDGETVITYTVHYTW